MMHDANCASERITCRYQPCKKIQGMTSELRNLIGQNLQPWYKLKYKPQLPKLMNALKCKPLVRMKVLYCKPL